RKPPNFHSLVRRFLASPKIHCLRLSSLSKPTKPTTTKKSPSISNWWNTIQIYMKKAGKKQTNVVLANQVSDNNYSIGKKLKKSQISKLPHVANSKPEGLNLVLTAQDVAVEGFCMSNCGFHGSDTKLKSAFIWLGDGNSLTQCPSQCAWLFHKPI
ncbi:protein exordium-like 4, partial [Quercus suber]